MDPQTVALITMIVTTIGGIVATYLQTQGKAREASAAQAIADGVTQGMAKLATGTAPLSAASVTKALGVAIQAAAVDVGHEGHPAVTQAVEALAPGKSTPDVPPEKPTSPPAATRSPPAPPTSPPSQ